MNLSTRTRRLALSLVALAVTVSLSAGVSLVALADGPRPGAPWPQLKRDGARSSLGTVNGPATLAQRWISNADAPITGGPIVGDDGTIYVTTDGPRLVAFRPDGTRKFVFTPENVSGKPTYPLLNAAGNVVFGTEDGYIIGVKNDGSQAWRFDTRDAPYGSADPQTITAPIGAGSNYGRILVGTYGGNVYELEDGVFHGVRRAEGSVRAGPAISPDTTVVWATTERTIYGGFSTGGDRWKHTLDGAIVATPAISSGNVIYVGTETGSLYAIQTDGKQLWNVRHGSRALRGGPSVGPDGTVYVGDDGGTLYAINPANGATRWTFATGGAITGAPAIGPNGTIYVGSLDRKVYVLHPSGVQQSSWTTEGQIDISSPAIGADGTLYIGSRDHRLYAFRDGGPANIPAATTPTPTAAPAAPAAPAPPPPTATPIPPAISTARAEPAADGLYFAETGHNLRGVFLDYFNANGGLAQYGYPRTEQITLPDGRIVQWFQRARLEYTPSNPALGIQLGLLGDEILTGIGALPR
ncbi:MAG TPA: PQQ-binding-like beta-propeller repeat protein [Chloroflexota bacterium]|nr:PQQ-binding-like beta-propeller repeat protein [Chloroflexota bacterium]